MVSRVEDNKLLGTQKTVSLDFEEENFVAHEGRQVNFKTDHFGLIVAASGYFQNDTVYGIFFKW